MRRHSKLFGAARCYVVPSHTTPDNAGASDRPIQVLDIILTHCIASTFDNTILCHIKNVNDFIRSRLDLMELLSDTKLRLLKNMILNYEGKFCFRCHINYSWNIYFSFSYTSLDALLNKCKTKTKAFLDKDSFKKYIM